MLSQRKCRSSVFCDSPHTNTEEEMEMITSPHPSFILHLEWDTSGAPRALPVSSARSSEAPSVHTDLSDSSTCGVPLSVPRLVQSCGDKTCQDVSPPSETSLLQFAFSAPNKVWTAHSQLLRHSLIWFIYGTAPSSKQIKQLVYRTDFGSVWPNDVDVSLRGLE